jgi:hypothetical protein
VELKEGTPVEEAALVRELQAMAAAHEVTRRIATFFVHPGFPVDIRHNSKIFREKLAVWAIGEMRRLGRK